MKNYISTFLGLILFYNISFSQETKVDEIKVGNSIIQLETKTFGEGGIFAVNLHSNESTSVAAAETVFQETGGRILKILNNDNRNVGFIYKGDSVFVDPNRIYTRKGIKATLKRLNKHYKAGTIREVKKLGTYITQQIPSGSSTIIALHNNTEGNLSILSYQPGGDEAETSAAFHQGMNDPDDFFLTTDADIYEKLKAKDHNITLQDNKRVPNDGSMSVFYGKKNRSYVNIEAQHGHIEEQIKMLRDLLEILTR